MSRQKQKLLINVTCLFCFNLVVLRSPKTVHRSPHTLLTYVLSKRCLHCGAALWWQRKEEYLIAIAAHQQFSLEEMREQLIILEDYKKLILIINKFLVEQIVRLTN